MPEVSQRIAVGASPGETWGFVKDIPSWAELMPGYQGIRVIDDANSEWKIKGDVGILTKLVTLDVHVVEWVERDHVDFTFKCREELLRANGSLRAEASGPDATTLTFTLAAESGGMLGPVIDALLGKVLPAMANDFATAVKRRIEARAQGSTRTVFGEIGP